MPGENTLGSRLTRVHTVTFTENVTGVSASGGFWFGQRIVKESCQRRLKRTFQVNHRLGWHSSLARRNISRINWFFHSGRWKPQTAEFRVNELFDSRFEEQVTDVKVVHVCLELEVVVVEFGDDFVLDVGGHQKGKPS